MTARRLLRTLAPCALAAALSLGACTADGEEQAPVKSPPQTSDDPASKDYVAPPLPTGKVLLEDAFGGAHLVEVEVAATDASRQRGMMWRTGLAEGKGMLFIFPRSQRNSFWMRNTLIPLDMAFIAEDGRIVGIVANAVPRSLNSRGVDALSKYVLEVPGGWLEKIGVRAGSKVEFRGISMITVE